MENAIECIGKQVDPADDEVTWIYFRTLKDNGETVLFELPVNSEDSNRFDIGKKFRIKFTEFQDI